MLPPLPRLAALVLIILGLGTPAGAVELRNGDLVVVDAGRSAPNAQPARVIRIDPVSGEQTLVSEGGLLVSPVAVAVQGTSTIFVSDSGAGPNQGAILRIDPADGAQTVVEGSFAGLLGMARDPASGDLFAADASEATLFRVDADAGGKAPVSGGGLLALPQAVTVAPSGLIFVTSFATSAWRVVGINPAVPGSQTSVASDFGLPAGIAADPSGMLWVADAQSAEIVRVDPGTGAKAALPGGGQLVIPFGIAVSGSQLFVTDWGALSVPPAVILKSSTTGAESVVSPGGLLNEPWAVAVVPEPAGGLLGASVWLALAWLRARRRRAAGVVAQRAHHALPALAIGLALGGAPAAQAQEVQELSNTAATEAQVGALFERTGPGLVASTDGNVNGVHVDTRVWRGRSGTAADGLFLYDYRVEPSPERRNLPLSFSLPFAPLGQLDIDAAGPPDDSAHCGDCTSDPAPTVPATALRITEGSRVVFDFPDGIEATSASLLLFSGQPPFAGAGRIQLEGVGSGSLLVLPEPAGAVTGWAAFAAFAALAAPSAGRGTRRGAMPRLRASAGPSATRRACGRARRALRTRRCRARGTCPPAPGTR
jgi:sugar lactone lactonase YvrE